MDAFARRARLNPLRPILWALVAAALLIGLGWLLARQQDRQERAEVAASNLDTLAVALREQRNRLSVYRLSGTVTTNREVRGGIGDILKGELTVRQPWSVAYEVDMAELGLDDYIWDEGSRTLRVRMPPVRPTAPNIDESRSVSATEGLLVTRTMQEELRTAVARGAASQAGTEAAKPANIAAATEAARTAIARNLQVPLAAAGLGNVRVVVETAGTGTPGSERWDVSRSIAEVLAERGR